MRVANSAAKLQMLVDLYDSGFLCECKKVVLVISSVTPDTYPFPAPFDEPHTRIDHEETCTGKKKFLELLGLKNE